MAGRTWPDESEELRAASGIRPTSRLMLASVLGITVICLRHEGRRWWCRQGDLSPWSGGIRGVHTSQHLVDPYSFTHILHGLLLHACLRPVARRLGPDRRLALAVALECGWEVVENSARVIGRYRRGTIALGYEGDSILNSLGDIASCGLGFYLAGRLPARWSIGLFLAVEAAMLVVYRDNLLLNVIMLMHPSGAVKAWQMGR